jgi:hypothetical protein
VAAAIIPAPVIVAVFGAATNSGLTATSIGLIRRTTMSGKPRTPTISVAPLTTPMTNEIRS